MPRAFVLSLALASLAVLSVSTMAGAADLSPNTRLGAVFAQPYTPAVPTVEVPAPPVADYPIFVFAPQNDVRPFIGGYYGKIGSYHYRPYYGYGEDTFTRLPYACGAFGYC